MPADSNDFPSSANTFPELKTLSANVGHSFEIFVSLFHRAVQTDDEVIADVIPSFGCVSFADSSCTHIASFGRSGAMNDYTVNLSHQEAAS